MNGYKEDINLLIKPSKKLVKQMTALQDLCTLEVKKEISCYNLKERPPIPFRLIKYFHQLNTEHEDKTYLHEMMEGCEVFLPKPEISPRNPELEARIRRLQAEQAEREYQQMTHNVRQEEKTSMKLGSEVKVVQAQVMGVLNFVLSVAGTFVFGYKAVEYSLESPAVPVQVLIGITMASIVALAEIYFLLKTL
ncbi:transmembrane protein 199-like isoform X2 [Limulus polyphemus]|uniref:Transmembrane protein 199-like isoform X2 n=1 Tax=Limulus polyphemus TaxID=6850 RepID=A0ABM1SSX0_LIMPO|nr:transmembrane protein 199-like isoform X2 [Limulus polyphemus]